MDREMSPRHRANSKHVPQIRPYDCRCNKLQEVSNLTTGGRSVRTTRVALGPRTVMIVVACKWPGAIGASRVFPVIDAGNCHPRELTGHIWRQGDVDLKVFENLEDAN